MLNKKVLGVGYEETNERCYLMIITNYGKRFVFSSESPIDIDVETEQ